MIKISPARQAAFEILQKIAVEKAFSAILLPKYEENLKVQDRALCHELTLGVLRNQTLLDAIIEFFSGKKINKLDLPVVLALRLGLYQLRFLTKIPVSAAVNESVNLVLAARLRSATNFANAILRRASREPDFNPLTNVVDPLEKLAIKTSHPVWLLEKWQNEFGVRETELLAEANNLTPPTAFRVTNINENQILEELREAGAELFESKIVPHAWRVNGAKAKLRELVAQNKVYLQDEASQMVAHLVQVQTNESFFDVCAAPGSKTSLVASLQINQLETEDQKSNLLIAGDLTVSRIKILRETMAKYAFNAAQIVQYDAANSLPFEAKSFDCVLVDAPCSGTGTIRHNPEIRWHLEPNDFEKLAAKQLRILNNAADLIRIGGRVIYSTCSIEKEENEFVITKFLEQNPHFSQATIDLSSQFFSFDNKSIRTFPHKNDVDGFFVTLLERKQ